MSCEPKCGISGSKDDDGRELMISRKGNKKFPKPMTIHPQCLGCLIEAIEKNAQEAIGDALTCLEKSLK